MSDHGKGGDHGHGGGMFTEVLKWGVLGIGALFIIPIALNYALGDGSKLNNLIGNGTPRPNPAPGIKLAPNGRPLVQCPARARNACPHGRTLSYCWFDGQQSMAHCD